ALDNRFRGSNIIPPVIEEWGKPLYHEPSAFFDGQRVMSLYTDLARQAPAQHTTPATVLANGALSYVLHKVVERVRQHGTDGLESQCQQWLDLAAADVQRRIEQGQIQEDKH